MAEGNDKPAAAPAASTEVADPPTQPQPQQQQPHPPPQDVVTYLTSLIDSAAIATSAHSSALNALASLSDSAGHFIPSSSGASSATPGECLLFLRAVSAHSDALSSLTEHLCPQLLEAGGAQAAAGGRGAAGGVGDEEDAGAFLKRLASVIQAVGFAAVLVTRRSDIGRSGIIPTLAKLALAPSSSPTASSPPPPYFALTPAHPELLQCCLLAGQYRFAARFADSHPVGSVALLPLPKPAAATSSTTEDDTSQQNLNVGRRVVFPGVTAETHLRYHYCLGLVKIGCDNLVSAVKAFESCLTTPARGAISAVQVAARKKMLLCRCLLDGGASRMDGDAKTEGSDLNAGGGFVGSQDPFLAGSGGGQGPKRSLRVRTILSVPPAASSAVSRYLSAASSSTSPSSPSKSSGRQSMGPAAGGGDPESEVQESSASSSRRGGNSRHTSRLEHERNYYCLKSYDDLVIAFCSGDGGRKFGEAKESIAELLETDGNMGLAVQMEAALKTAAVRQTARVYEAASLAKVAGEVDIQNGPESQKEAERLILSMMPAPRPYLTLENSRVDSLEARIDQGNSTVRFGPFGDDDEFGNGGSWLMDDEEDGELGYVDLSARMGACAALAKRVTALDLSVATSNRFQQISVRGEAQSAATASSGSGGKGGSGSGGEAGPKSVAELAG